MIRYDRAGVLERAEVSIDDVAALRLPGQILWLEVEGLSDERALRRIAELFTIHPLALADVVNVGQRPKAEAYADFELVIARMACSRGGALFDLEQVSIVLGRDFVVSFHEGARDLFEPVRQRIRGGALVRQMGADYLAYALLDTLIDGYYPIVEAIGAHLEELEEAVSGDPAKELLERIHRARRDILTFVRVIHQQRDAVGAMMRGDHPLIGEPVRVYLRDSFDHASQISDVLDTFREISIGLVDVYLSSVSHRTNETIRVLTILSSIFIPLTFIVGVYGMNFEHMPELHWRYGYYLTWVVMLVVVATLLVYFRRNGWIGSKRPDSE